MEVTFLFNTWLVSGCEQKVFRLYFTWTRGGLSETLKALLQRFWYPKRTKNGFNVTICLVVKRVQFAFLYVKAKFARWQMSFRFPTLIFLGVWHLQTADRRLQTADCRPQTADCRLQITDCPQWTSDRRLQDVDWGLLVENLVDRED